MKTTSKEINCSSLNKTQFRIQNSEFRIIYIVTFLLLFSSNSFAQTDAFTGTWQMEYYFPGEKMPLRMELQIASPEKNLLYPAELKLQYDSFAANYHLLLVKRNIRQLAIGKNKVPSSEVPFSIGNWAIYLNGILDLSKDLKGNSFLSAERIYAKHYGVNMEDPAKFPSTQQTSATHLRDFLKDADIKLKKINNSALQDVYIDSILNPHISPAYYGIQDTVISHVRDGNVNFSGSKKNSGVVSVILNGNNVIDQNDLSVKRPAEDIRLDTGLNILVFFADSYGKTVNSTGNVFVEIGKKKFSMDFADKKDLAATFIVTKIYYIPEADSSGNPGNGLLKELSESDIRKDIKVYHYPDPTGRNLYKDEAAKAEAEKTLLRNTKPIGEIKTTSREIILALWDDAVEDGDTISLSINGHWIVQGFPVKKQPQFISVMIDPGPNRIIFVANNLGAIPPNTAVLEIIDNKQRRAFMLETDLTESNLIKIMYEGKP